MTPHMHSEDKLVNTVSVGTGSSRHQAWAVAAPIACACAATGGASYLAARNPLGHGRSLLPCPLYVSTGLYCPGCGLTRAGLAFLRGNIAQAFGYNIFFPLFFAAIAVAWWGWLRAALGRPAIKWLVTMPTRVPVGIGAVLITFAVLRNLSPFASLAP
jgi:hypothetical protein